MAGQVGSSTIVLLTGERGVGKDFAARLIHAASARRERPFVKVNCASPVALLETQLFGRAKEVTSGQRWMLSAFEYANKGIMFLDNLDALPRGLAPKLLDVLRFGRVSRNRGPQSLALDVAILAASRPIHAASEEFWADFGRVNVVEARLAPLRERRNEIPELASSFLCEFNCRYERAAELPAETLSLFMQYRWPENVRELRNVIQRFVTGDAERVHEEIESAIADDRMQRGRSALGKTGKSKARPRNATKDLPPKNTKQVKGGGVSGKVQFNEFSITKVTDKSSPVFWP